MAHPKPELSCTDCHGGDASEEDKQKAHVQPTLDWVKEREGYIKNLSVNELNALSEDFLRFKNPGDYRVAEFSCGKGSPSADESGCHQSLVESAPRSVMSTFVGHFNIPRFQAGMQEQDAVIASQAVESLFRDEADPPAGAVPSLEQAVPPPEDAPRDQVDTLMDNYLTKNCTHCHQNSFGRNDAPGNFRSSGCTSCHMLYANDGYSLSADPSAQKDLPPHPIKHELTTQIGVEQCEHCHYQGARIGLHYRGVIEWGFEEESDLEDIGEQLHAHDSDFYRFGGDQYPADLHYTAGLSCADCHIGRDVHGDGRLYSTAKQQLAIRCENCHGNIDQNVQKGRATAPLVPGGDTEPSCQPDGPEDQFLNCAGDPLKRLTQRDDGSIWLELNDGSKELRVPQVHALLELDRNPRMATAMGRHPETGASHTEKVECVTCHTSYVQYCFGCHVSMDYSILKADGMTGQRTPGAETTSRDFTSLDLFFVGKNERDKMGVFCPSMQVFMDAADRDDEGRVVEYFNDRIRERPEGKKGFNWAVHTPHSVSKISQPCTRCHADQTNNCDDTMARESYGFGTGRYKLTDDKGVEHDLTQLLNEDGEPLVDFSHRDQGPVDPDVRQRALDVCVSP